METDLTFGSLFSGIGGMDLGLERAGMVCKWQVEIDPFCRKVLEKHWPHVPKHGDIREVRDLESVDLIAGGFPCQDVSTSGQRRGISEGTRSGLWASYARIIGSIRPAIVLIENVSGLLANEPMRRVLGDLSALGYDAEWDMFPARFIGAPHERERIWIIAYPNGAGPERPFLSGQDLRLSARPSSTEFGNRRVPCGGWWSNVPSLRVGNGIRARLDRDRIRSLGNAVVPQVSEWIGRRIMETDLTFLSHTR